MTAKFSFSSCWLDQTRDCISETGHVGKNLIQASTHFSPGNIRKRHRASCGVDPVCHPDACHGHSTQSRRVKPRDAQGNNAISRSLACAQQALSEPCLVVVGWGQLNLIFGVLLGHDGSGLRS